MKASAGGSVGPVRGGVSNRGVGIGVGPVSAGVSHKEAGGCLQWMILGTMAALAILLCLALAPIALAIWSITLLVRGEKVPAGVILAIALIWQATIWHYWERETLDQVTNGVKIADVERESESEARSVLAKQGIRHIKVKYPDGEPSKDCSVRQQRPSSNSQVSPKYGEVVLTMTCFP